MSKQDNYRELSSCANCAHVFVRREYDAGDSLYCTHNAPPRPPCMSVRMGGEEYPHEIMSEDASRARDDWYEWSKDRRVEPNGKCKAYKVRRA